MGAVDGAKAHLAKAEEFLNAAEVNFDLALFNAATSNAVSSGINSKDAICLAPTGRTAKTDNHSDAGDAGDELKRVCGEAATLAPQVETADRAEGQIPVSGRQRRASGGDQVGRVGSTPLPCSAKYGGRALHVGAASMVGTGLRCASAAPSCGLSLALLAPHQWSGLASAAPRPIRVSNCDFGN